MNIKNKELIAEIESRLQFIITIATVFPTLIYFVFIWLGHNEKETVDTTLKWFSPAAFYLANYVIFQYFKIFANEKHLKIFNYFLLFGIFCFIIPISFIASRKYSLIPNLDFLSFTVSIYGIGLAPILTLFYLTWFCIDYYRKKDLPKH